MEKILLFDHASDGHHKLYAKTIIQGLLHDNVNIKLCFLTCPTWHQAASNNLDHESLTRHIPFWVQTILNYLPTRIRSILIVLFVLAYARIHGFKKIHFLYLDCCILALFLFIPLTLGLTISGTLHRFPAQKSKSFILTLLLKLQIILKLMVHGEYTRTQLIKSRKAFAFILAFGGLRHEKGIDILIASLACMEQESTLLVAGPESSFKASDLTDMIAQYGIAHKVFLDIRYIPDDLLSFYFDLCDIVVLPYRKTFLGISGPLTEGVSRSKIIIGPNHGEIGFTLQHYGLGLVYESENINALAHQIDHGILHAGQFSAEIQENQTRYHKLIDVEAFKNNYKNFIFAKAN
jgi:glycosyltransferase involved in cell wall biosynthesis